MKILTHCTIALILTALFFHQALNAMQIYVSDHSFEAPRTCSLDMEPTDTIQNLKGKITEQWGIGPSLQYLYFNTVFLEDNRTLADYNIQKESTIDLYSYDTSLPVELIAFSAHVEGSQVVLRWTTASAVDHLGFVLDKAVNQQPLEWEKIASYETHEAMKGQGNTSQSEEYAFTDMRVTVGTTYLYRLSEVSLQGEVTVYAPLLVTLKSAPVKTEMGPAYPNPFNPMTLINYQLEEGSRLTITVYDVCGRHVKPLYEGEQIAGTYQVFWNGTDAAGRRMPTGVYIIQMKTDKLQQIQKVMLVK